MQAMLFNGDPNVEARAGAARRSLATALFVAGTFVVRPTGVAAEPPRGDPRAIALIDQRGMSFHLADLRGRPTLLTFVATRCTDACPLAEGAFESLSRRLHRDGIDARLVTITLDPGYDTPFVMARAAKSFNAAPRRWTFASGRPGDVRRLMRSFGVVAAKSRNGVPELHTSFVYVLDRRVRLTRTLLLSSDFSSDAEKALNDGGLASAFKPPH